MARPPTPTPAQQLPQIEYILAVIELFKLFKPSELSKLGLQEALAAEKIHRKDLKLIVDVQVDDSVSASPVLDVKQLNTDVSDDSTTMARLLKRAGLGSEVTVALKAHNGTLPIAQALLAVAKQSKDPAVRGLLPGFSAQVEQLDEAQQRQAAGGHPAFDLKISTSARECWVHTDTATNLLACCLLKAGIVNDATYGMRPTVKSVLRPVLEAAATPVYAKKSAKKGKTNGSKASTGGQPAPMPPPSPVPSPQPTT